jgi:hypothetical protein
MAGIPSLAPVPKKSSFTGVISLPYRTSFEALVLKRFSARLGMSGLLYYALLRNSLAISIYGNHFGSGLLLDLFDELWKQSLGEDISLFARLGMSDNEVIGFKITA